MNAAPFVTEAMRIRDETLTEAVNKINTDIATEMLKDALPISAIVKYTHLTENAVIDLARNLNITPNMAKECLW